MKGGQHLRVTESRDIATYGREVGSCCVEARAFSEREQKSQLGPTLFFGRFDGLGYVDGFPELVDRLICRTSIAENAPHNNMAPRSLESRHIVASENSLRNGDGAAGGTGSLEQFSKKRVPRSWLLLWSANRRRPKFG